MIFSAQIAGCRLVNLGSSEISVGEGVLAPQEVIQIPGETMLKIGEFSLILHAGTEALLDLPSVGKNIAIAVSMPFTRLEPGRSLSGSVRVRNQGDQGSVQVDLDIEGLDPACYTIEPGPVLAQGAEKEVAFRIYHRGSQPPAGLHPISIRATSLHAYSGEEVSLTQSIQVLPSYTFEMDLLPPGSALPTPSTPGRPSSAASLNAAPAMKSPLPVRSRQDQLIPAPSRSPQKDSAISEIWEAAQPLKSPRWLLGLVQNNLHQRLSPLLPLLQPPSSATAPSFLLPHRLPGPVLLRRLPLPRGLMWACSASHSPKASCRQ
jgi:hypothetical protein